MKKILCVLTCVCVAVCGIFTANTIMKKNKLTKYNSGVVVAASEYVQFPQNKQSACYIFDPEDKEIMSGYSDYISVVYVKDVKGTTYQNVREDDGQIKGTPYTSYELEICENIKGELKTDVTIPFLQYGGVSIDKESVVYITPFLEQGKCYVLYSSVASDSNLYVNQAYELDGIAGKSECLAAIKAGTDNALLAEFYAAYDNENIEFSLSSHYSTPYDSLYN